jgi:predicted  nucleic acid-binding Zn-ribbon protein
MSAENRAFVASKTNIVRPTALQSFKTEVSPSSYRDDSLEQHSFVGDRFHNRFHSTRKVFEAKQQETNQRSPTVSGNLSPAQPSSPVTERIQSFSELKQRFEADVNNNNTQALSPRGTRHTSYGVGNVRHSWASSSSPNSSRRSSDGSTELNDKSRRPNDMSIIREKIAIAKEELAEANERREVAERGYAEAKHRIMSSKSQSRSLRDEIRSLEENVERKEKKIEEMTKRLAARTVIIEQNQRAATFYEKDIEHESEMVDELSKKIEAARERRRATVQQIRDLTQRIPPVKAAIDKAETRLDEARKKSRRCGDILTKSTIRLKNARTLQANAAERTSFKGLEVEEAQKRISDQKERLKKAKADIKYVEYRRDLLADQLAERRDDIRKVVMRLKPHQQQKALGFICTRLPMSEEL